MSDLELRSQLYAWLGDRTSKPDGDAHDHESLRLLSADLAEKFASPAPVPAAARGTWRDQLAERLIVWWAESGGVTVDEVRAVNEGAAEAYADAVLPVLERARQEAVKNCTCGGVE